MKTFNVIGIITILTLLGFGYYLKTKQDEVTNKALVIILQNDEKTNKRVTDINRKVYKDYAMISREDACKVVKTHIREKHTSNGHTCREFIGFKKK